MIPPLDHPTMLPSSNKLAPPSPETTLTTAPIRKSGMSEQKLRKATQEFEAMFIANFWKSMTDSFSDGDEDSLDPGHSSWRDMGVQALSEALAKQGGFGLGKMILNHLDPLVQNAAAAQKGAPTP